jgi:large subunit ribosomal protein L20
MVRIKHAVSTRKRKKRVMKMAKGQFGHRSRRFRQAIRSIIKGLVYAYRDRKVKKREFRRLWIARINAACRQHGTSYSRFMNGLLISNVTLNRKVLAELAVREPESFKALVDVANKAQTGSAKKAQPAVAAA